MNKDENNLKMQFSAYVKKSILNERGRYLKKKNRIENIETNFIESLIVQEQSVENLLKDIELLYKKISAREIRSEMLLEQIEDIQLFKAITSLTEVQKKIILLRIFYEITFQEIGGLLGISEKKAENTYYNAVKKMRKIMRGNNNGI